MYNSGNLVLEHRLLRWQALRRSAAGQDPAAARAVVAAAPGCRPAGQEPSRLAAQCPAAVRTVRVARRRLQPGDRQRSRVIWVISSAPCVVPADGWPGPAATPRPAAARRQQSPGVAGRNAPTNRTLTKADRKGADACAKYLTNLAPHEPGLFSPCQRRHALRRSGR